MARSTKVIAKDVVTGAGVCIAAAGLGEAFLGDGLTPLGVVAGYKASGGTFLGAVLGGLLGGAGQVYGRGLPALGTIGGPEVKGRLDAIATAQKTYDAAPRTSGLDAALTPWQGWQKNVRLWGNGQEAARINRGVTGAWGWVVQRPDGYRLAAGSSPRIDYARRAADAVLARYTPGSSMGVGGGDTPELGYWHADDVQGRGGAVVHAADGDPVETGAFWNTKKQLRRLRAQRAGLAATKPEGWEKDVARLDERIARIANVLERRDERRAEREKSEGVGALPPRYIIAAPHGHGPVVHVWRAMDRMGNGGALVRQHADGAFSWIVTRRSDRRTLRGPARDFNDGVRHVYLGARRLGLVLGRFAHV